MVAIISIDSTKTQSPPILRILSLSDLKVIKVARLYPQEESQENADAYDRWAAAGLKNQLQWSPDGNIIAFNGVIDGPSGDLYTYVVSSQLLTRLTDGPTESVFPFWSLDGEFIIQGGVEHLNLQMSGAGYDYEVV